MEQKKEEQVYSPCVAEESAPEYNSGEQRFLRALQEAKEIEDGLRNGKKYMTLDELLEVL
ncbi:MAG: hypothetical protein MJZ31_12585 [Bacteroidales bacterium]|nr:hypothetical protein [Bacteroidales bacterium]